MTEMTTGRTYYLRLIYVQGGPLIMGQTAGAQYDYTFYVTVEKGTNQS